jgi:Na+/melibiose symporter-like transporter
MGRLADLAAVVEESSDEEEDSDKEESSDIEPRNDDYRGSIARSNVTVEFTMVDLLADSIYRLNLIVMVLSWVASSFCFFIIGFYIKYIPGDIYSNMIAMNIADAASSVAAGLMAQYYGTKSTLTISFACAAIGGVCLILCP